MVGLLIVVKYINYTLCYYNCKENWEKQLISLQFKDMLRNPHLGEMHLLVAKQYPPNPYFASRRDASNK